MQEHDQATTLSSQKPDLSKATLVALVLLTLVVSILSTWSVLYEINNMEPAPVSKASAQSAQVSLNIVNPGATAASAKELSATTGRVTLNIIEYDD